MLACLVLFSGSVFAERFVPTGSTVGFFDFHRHTHDAPKRTFPENVGRVDGCALLPDGKVAVLLADEKSPGPHPKTIYLLAVDPFRPDSFEIAGGPIIPRYSANTNLVIESGPALYRDDEFVLIGYWQDVQANIINHRHFLLRMPRTGGEASLITELPLLPTSGPYRYNEVAYLPSDGTDPDVFVLGITGGPPPEYSRFRVVTVGGVTIRDIDYPALHLNTRYENLCEHNLSLTVTPGGDLLSVRTDDRADAPTCPWWGNVSCVRFNRYGQYKGAWDFGRSLPQSPWLPSSGVEIVQLPNGDLFAGARFAEYDLRDGDGNGTTYRNFIVRPPEQFYLPKCQLDLGEPVSTVKAGLSSTGTVRVANIGFAELQVSSMRMDGSGASGFTLEDDTAFSLSPGWGSADAPGASATRQIVFRPTSVGQYAAEVVAVSNDPEHPEQHLPIRGVCAPPEFEDVILFDPSAVFGPSSVARGVSVSAVTGKALLVMEDGAGTSNPTVRILEMPLLRGADDRILSFNTGSLTALVTHLPASVVWAMRGPDGVLWYGPSEAGKGRIVQRKADGAEFDLALPTWSASPFVDGDFTRDGQALLLALEGLNAPARFDLTPRGDGFHDLTFRLGLNRCATDSSLTALAVLPDPAKELLLVHASQTGETVLFVGRSDAFWLDLEHPDPLEGIPLADGLRIGSMGRDPGSGDVLYLDDAGRVHRLSGVLDFIPPKPPPRPRIEFTVESDGTLAMSWDLFGVDSYVESSTNLTQWDTIAGPLRGNLWSTDIGEVPINRFIRLRCVNRSP